MEIEDNRLGTIVKFGALVEGESFEGHNHQIFTKIGECLEGPYEIPVNAINLANAQLVMYSSEAEVRLVKVTAKVEAM